MRPNKPIVKIVPIQTEQREMYRLEVVEGTTLLNTEQAEEFIEQLRASIDLIKMAEKQGRDRKQTIKNIQYVHRRIKEKDRSGESRVLHSHTHGEVREEQET